MKLLQTIVQTVCGGLVGLAAVFILSWSDTVKRKPKNTGQKGERQRKGKTDMR